MSVCILVPILRENKSHVLFALLKFELARALKYKWYKFSKEKHIMYRTKMEKT